MLADGLGETHVDKTDGMTSYDSYFVSRAYTAAGQPSNLATVRINNPRN